MKYLVFFVNKYTEEDGNWYDTNIIHVPDLMSSVYSYDIKGMK